MWFVRSVILSCACSLTGGLLLGDEGTAVTPPLIERTPYSTPFHSRPPLAENTASGGVQSTPPGPATPNPSRSANHIDAGPGEDLPGSFPVATADLQQPDFETERLSPDIEATSGAARARRSSAHGASTDPPDGRSWSELRFTPLDPLRVEPGIGYERVMFAPFYIESAQPFTHLALLYENGWNLREPDRSEFFWAAPPTGPGPERSVDVTTLTARMETAMERASAIFAVPLRAVDPELNRNTSGIGDLTVGGKLVLVSGRDWVVTQQTLTYLKTGPAGRGMGTGHVSMEPGLLARYRWADDLYLHGQLRYVIPLSGTDDFAGEVLLWGLGASGIWHETDAFAILPTFEIVGVSFLDGQRTTPTGRAVDVDGETTVEFLPGLRFVLGPQGDLGLPEIGISGGASVGDRGWFAGRLQLVARWSF